MNIAMSSLNGLKDYFDVSKNMQKLKDIDVRFVLFTSQDAPLFVVDALKAAFEPETGSGKLYIEMLTASSVEKAVAQTDVCIIVNGKDMALELTVAKRWQEAGVPVYFIGQSSENVEIAEIILPELSCSLAQTQLQVKRDLARFMVNVLSQDKAISAAFCFSFLRRALVLSLSQKMAVTNAAIGAVDVIPGADFPAMVLSESTLLAQVGALYGQEQTELRVLDFVGVLVWALASRSTTKYLEKYLPLPKSITRGGLAFASSYALGYVVLFRYAASKNMEKKIKETTYILLRSCSHIAEFFERCMQRDVPIDDEVVYQI